MNTSNPFQIPSCLQRVDFQQRRRERFKNGFIAAVAAMVVLLVGLLIEGCKTEQATSAAAPPSVGVTQPQITQPLVADQRLNPAPQPNVNPVVRPVAPVSQPQTLYVVKSGDTLSRIAKAHGTTVKALKSANSLEGDRIVVGAKLKIPTA
jgi:nucleoid-associated protein YgaU